jgi:microsomal prostaglandin-E synthase 1
MMDVFHSTAFGTYSLFAMAITMLLLSIDMFGGVLLPRKKSSLPTKDAATGAQIIAIDGHARVMATHRNAVANIVPFLSIMLLYVLLGASPRWVIMLCGVFAVMRVAHAIAHIRGIQPWRTIVWLAAQLCLFVAMFQVVRASVAIV